MDASALLAFVQQEAGADAVETALLEGANCSAANWSEVAQKMTRRGRWPAARALIQSYGVIIEPVTEADAERAAARWINHPMLSLADRLCLALADRLDTTAMTADQSWAADPRTKLIR